MWAYSVSVSLRLIYQKELQIKILLYLYESYIQTLQKYSVTSSRTSMSTILLYYCTFFQHSTSQCKFNCLYKHITKIKDIVKNKVTYKPTVRIIHYPLSFIFSGVDLPLLYEIFHSTRHYRLHFYRSSRSMP
jgi:hypothetical protein